MDSELFPSQETLFFEELQQLQRIYAVQLVENARQNADLLIDLHWQWEAALRMVAESYDEDVPETNLPSYLERKSQQKLLEEADAPARSIVGLAGPGATGKETVARALGYSKIINTTTRTRRDYEVQDVHYHFIDEPTFSLLEAQGEFATITEREGRGRYGIQRQDLELGLSSTGMTIIEENPETLEKLSQFVGESMPDTRFFLTYILPPDPVQLHLAIRLANRCLVAGEDYRQAIKSTLGKRQIDEFISVMQAQEAGTTVLYVVNDQVDRAVSTIQTITGMVK